MHTRQLILVAALSAALSTSAVGRVRRVPSEYPTIGAAIGAANKGDTILVAPGVYEESVDLNKFVTLLSEAGPGQTVIDGGGASETIHISNGYVSQSNDWVIDGFLVTGGGTGIAASMPVPDATTLIANCIIRGNSGAGVWVTGHSTTVRDCVIQSNGGPGIGFIHDADIAPCSALGNVITDCSAGIRLVCFGCDFIIEHNTIVGNTEAISITRIAVGGPGVLSSNIVAGNDWGVCINQPFDPYDCNTVHHNDIWGNVLDVCPGGDCDGQIIGFNGNISLDPEFCDATAGDFTLAEDSPCVGAGAGGTDIGALGVACGPQSGVSEAEKEFSWGLIKALFRGP